MTPEIDETTCWKSAIKRDLFMLPLGSLVCIALTVWLSQMLHIPAVYAKAGVLLQQPGWPVAIATAWIALVAGAMLASIFAGHVHYDGGLFCACIGLAAFSIRMGPTRFMLFNATGPIIFVSCAVELILLFIAVGIAWLLLRSLAASGWLHAETAFDAGETDEPMDQNLVAVAAQIVIMLLLMCILSQSDRKPQTLASVGIASYVAALITHHFIVATRPSAWFWIGPLVVGLIGYLGQYINPSGMALGDIQGLFAPLARPRPARLRQPGRRRAHCWATGPASAGTANARRWKREFERQKVKGKSKKFRRGLASYSPSVLLPFYFCLLLSVPR